MAVVTVKVVDSIADHPLGTVLRNVEVTDRLRRRVKLGYYQVIDGDLNAKVDDGNDDDDSSPNNVVDPPAKNASRADWAAFLADRDVEFTNDYTRDDLIDLWENRPRGEG